jgi:hypothetical protein
MKHVEKVKKGELFEVRRMESMLMIILQCLARVIILSSRTKVEGRSRAIMEEGKPFWEV